jgi:hypothetical protein
VTKREQLQAIADDAVKENPEYYNFTIEWKGGWWAIPEEKRHFNDQGEFLGYNFKQAEKTLLFLLP